MRLRACVRVHACVRACVWGCAGAGGEIIAWIIAHFFLAWSNGFLPTLSGNKLTDKTVSYQANEKLFRYRKISNRSGFFKRPKKLFGLLFDARVVYLFKFFHEWSLCLSFL